MAELKQRDRSRAMGRRRGAGRRPAKRKLRSRRWWGVVFFLAALAVAATIAVPLVFMRGSQEPSSSRAAIVDQLSLTEPNPDFTEEVTDMLEGAGYTVDYYTGEQVTVDFYRGLPVNGYDLIIFRNHAARRPDVLASRLPDEAALFTSEAYDRNKYVDDQDTLRLVKVSYPGSDEVFFGVRSDFITSSMKGRFDGTAIVLMGCNGLTTTRTAEAFVEKGAKAVVGWSELVSASHTDDATERLLRHLVVDGQTLEEAVEKTMADVGPDPAYGSVLRVHPPEAAASTIRQSS